MAAKKKSEPNEVQVVRVNRGQVSFCILGRTPIILNRMSQKGLKELLFPARKSRSARNQTLKHDPLQEYRQSPYTTSKEDSPTFIEHLASSFKAAMRGAALDIPDVSKAEIGRLTWVEGDRVSVYGVPQMFMSVVRQAGINKTPDVRTRAIIPEWACYITISYAKPQLNSTAVTNLLVAAGLTQGVGDWRNEKGSGSYGAFDVVNDDNKTFHRIIETGGREVQIQALEDPGFYDDETGELYSWFKQELVIRGKEEQLAAEKAKTKSKSKSNGTSADLRA